YTLSLHDALPICELLNEISIAAHLRRARAGIVGQLVDLPQQARIEHIEVIIRKREWHGQVGACDFCWPRLVLAQKLNDLPARHHRRAHHAKEILRSKPPK